MRGQRLADLQAFILGLHHAQDQRRIGEDQILAPVIRGLFDRRDHIFRQVFVLQPFTDAVREDDHRLVMIAVLFPAREHAVDGDASLGREPQEHFVARKHRDQFVVVTPFRPIEQLGAQRSGHVRGCEKLRHLLIRIADEIPFRIVGREIVALQLGLGRLEIDRVVFQVAPRAGFCADQGVCRGFARMKPHPEMVVRISLGKGPFSRRPDGQMKGAVVVRRRWLGEGAEGRHRNP